MSKIHMLNIPSELERAKDAMKSILRGSHEYREADADVVRAYIECLGDALIECRDGNVPPSKPMNLEKRIDAAGVYLTSLSVRPSAMPLAQSWVASADTDRIGDARASFTCHAESPADAIAAVLEQAAAWVKKQRDIR